MSALRNTVQRRNHKERAQPQERSKWGLLEKHKDYSLRAKDHNEKKRKIKALQAKASQRNEDEFYFGMMSSQTRGGVKVAKRGQENSGGLDGAGKVLSVDVVKLMKTQDAAYLRTVLQSTRKAKERLQKEVVIQEKGVSNDSVSLGGKKLFDDHGYELPSATSEDALDSLDDDLDGFDNFDELEDGIVDEVLDAKTSEPGSERRRSIIVQKKLLATLREREQSLATALREVEDQQARMNGRSGGINKHGTPFKSRVRQG